MEDTTREEKKRDSRFLSKAIAKEGVDGLDLNRIPEPKRRFFLSPCCSF
jgi:hypothetical protein